MKGLTAPATPVLLYRGAFHWGQVSLQRAAHFPCAALRSQLLSFQTSDTDSSHAGLTAWQPLQRSLSCLQLWRQLPNKSSARASRDTSRPLILQDLLHGKFPIEAVIASRTDNNMTPLLSQSPVWLRFKRNYENDCMRKCNLWSLDQRCNNCNCFLWTEVID